MPEVGAAKIPDADNVWLECECSRDLAIDDRHGPYPIVVFLHGAASFRAQSAFLATHWASRGFIVIAPDLPGVGLRAALGGERGSAFGVPRRLLDAIARAPADDPFAFARARLGSRLAIVGHSLGSMLASTISDRDDIDVFIAMAGAATTLGRARTLVLAGDRDQIAPADRMRGGMVDTPAGTRLAIVRGAGHLAFTDLCTLGADRGGALAIARSHGVAVPELIATLATDGCRPTDKPFAATAPAIRAVTAGALEERLRCDPVATRALATLASRHDIELIEQRRDSR
jgi:predicted dienelactone hydrolase